MTSASAHATCVVRWLQASKLSIRVFNVPLINVAEVSQRVRLLTWVMDPVHGTTGGGKDHGAILQ